MDGTKDNDGIMVGQMCYDELEPILEEVKDDLEEIDGQMSLMELQNKGNTNAKEGQKLKDKKEIEILEEIEKDRATKKTKKKANSQVKFDLNDMEESNIIPNALEEVLHNSMIPYTEYVVLDRALPRVEDGLKPVQRRILYTMLELNLEPDKAFRKSARIVGDCMGKYHPHGDSSVYDAMVRMSQNFILREPLVLGHGNFGSIDGDSAAAMRYTEAKLTPLAMELLRDLDKNTVQWTLNFDDSMKEPTMLPGRFPNLLVNGASGIAVGVATNIPPHNLTEVIDGTIAYIDNPKISLDEMMKIIKGPDFPTGGIIFTGTELRQAYETGRGRIIVRAKIEVETSRDRKSLIITEIPYQTNKATLLQKIAEVREKNKNILSGIVEINDESDRNGMRAVIRLRKDANEEAILEILYRQTGLEATFGINIVAIADGKPKTMGLLDIISYYAEYQREIIFRRTKFDLEQNKEKVHILEGLLIAIQNIDEVIKTIKASTSVSDAKLKLRTRFDLTERQAQAILDMRLARLVNLEVVKLMDELKSLKELIEKLTKIYESKRRQRDVVKTELREIRNRFKSARKSIIDKREIVRKKTRVRKSEEIVLEREVVLAITADKLIKAIPIKNYNLAQREVVNENTTLSHVHTQLLNIKSTKTVLIFTDKGNCYKVVVDKIPEIKWKEKGIQLKALDKKIPTGENPVRIIEVPKKIGKQKLVFFTKLGMVKQSLFSEYNISRAYFQAIKLKDDDEVINVELYEDRGSILLVADNTMVLNFEKDDIPTQGRSAGGVKGISLDENAFVMYGTQIIENGYLAILTDKGFAKRVQVAEFGLSSRARKGLRAISLVGKGKKLVYANFRSDEENILVDTERQGLKLLEGIEIESRIAEGGQKIKDRILFASNYCV